MISGDALYRSNRVRSSQTAFRCVGGESGFYMPCPLELFHVDLGSELSRTLRLLRVDVICTALTAPPRYGRDARHRAAAAPAALMMTG
jgi:hypothetical protein